MKENWTAAVKADQSARTDEMLAGLEGDKLQQKTMELLSITYSMNGPKVASAEKKLLAQWTDAERNQNREARFVPCWMKARPCRRPWLPPWAS